MLWTGLRSGTWLGSVVPGCVAFSCPVGRVGPTVGPDPRCCVLCICCLGSAPPPWLLPDPRSSSADFAWHESPGAFFAHFTLIIQYNCLSLKTPGITNIEVTSVALSPWDLDTFLVGSEGGLSVTLRAPVQFSFSTRGGPVHSVHFSPFHRNLFVNVGTDSLAHLHTVLQPRPLLSLRVSDSYTFGVRWSPTRPLVFAAATGQGLVQMFDLGRRSLRPVATIDQNTSGQPTYCLEFNPKHTNLMAVGNADGSINIWQLSAELTEQGAKEMAMLEQLANEVAD
uniref:WD repeat domain 34 n=1 Tax=Sinocyclocheilus anshuiensis TaxID=1608454 RepID=A0A671P2M7_9TELE